MAYLDRLRTAEYLAPSGGAPFYLQFDSLERAGGKKAAVHEFPQQDAVSVQDLGGQAVRFPLACYISGPDYDQEADRFWEALGERGPATLRHPRYGDQQVLALSFTQSERFVDGLGRAEFAIEFIVIDEAAAALPRTSVALEVTAAAAGETAAATLEAVLAEDAATIAAANAADLSTSREAMLEASSSLASAGEALIGAAEDGSAIGPGVRLADTDLDALAERQAFRDQVASAFGKSIRELETGIDTLMLDPVALADSWISCARQPALVVSSIGGKISAYAGQLDRALTFNPLTALQRAVHGITLTGLTLGAVSASLTGTLQSRQEAVAAADALSGLYRQALAGLEAVGADPSLLLALSDAASLAGRALLERSYTLDSERRRVLATERTPLDFVYEVYGGIDRLDEFLRSNGLGGDALLLMPAGREVVYYA